MSAKAEQVFNEALSLPPCERAQLAERIFSSLDIPQEELAHLWEREADSRIEAYECGELKAIPAHKILKTFFQKKIADEY